MKGNNNQLIKVANRYLILDSLRKSDLLTMDQIARKTKLSYPTIRNITQELVNMGLVCQAGQAESAGGRQPALYRLNAGSYYSMGIDVAPPVIRLAVSDLKYNLIHSRVEYYHQSESKMSLLDFIINMCTNTMDEVGVNKEQYVGLGIGVPGLIDVRTNTSILMERMENGDERIDISERLEKILGLHVYIRNDVHLIGLLERNLNLNRQEKNFVYIALRSGVGMATFSNGKLIDGTMGNAGYIGHTTIDVNGRECICGKRGCLEIMVNSDYLVEQYNSLRKEKGLEFNPIECDGWNYLNVFSSLAEKGDPDAIEVVRSAGKALGIGVSNVIKLLDITYFVFGGFPKESQNLFMDAVEASIRDNIHRYIMANVHLVRSNLNFNMAALGGCVMAIDNFFRGPRLSLTI